MSVNNTVCPGKKRDKNVFVISSTKLGRCWWYLVYSLVNEFAEKSCKRFPPWNTYHPRPTTALSEKETPEFIPPQLWPPNSPDLNTVDYSLQEKVHKIRITDRDELKQRLRTEWAKLDHVIIVAAIHQCHRRQPSSLAIFSHTLINWIQIWRILWIQLRWDKYWNLKFIYVTTQWYHLHNQQFKFHKVV